MTMENITFDNLPQAISLLLEKMEKLEQLLCGRSAEKITDQKPMGVKEAAAFLEISVPTVYSKVCRGKLPAYKPGRKLYFDEEMLIEHIKSAKKQANQVTVEHIEHPAPQLPKYKKRKAIRF